MAKEYTCSRWNKNYVASYKFMGRCLIFGFLLGLALAICLCKETIVESGLFGTYFFYRLQEGQVERWPLFWYLLFRRTKLLVLVFAGAWAGRERTAVGLACMWVGGSLAVLLYSLSLQQGIVGVLFYIFGLFPVSVVYIPLFLWYFYQIMADDGLKPLVTLTIACCAILPILWLESCISFKFLQKVYILIINIL